MTRTPEQIRAYKQGWEKRRLADPTYRDARNVFQRQYRRQMGHTALIWVARSRAKRRGLECNLVDDWKNDVTHCELSGLPFVKNDPMYAASIDRIDNSKGYTVDNCRLILRGLNVFKNNHSDETMMRVATALVDHQRSLQ